MKSSFQTILVVVFVVVFAGAVLVFSGLISFGSKQADSTPQGVVDLWGIVPQEAIEPYINDFNATDRGYTISYREHNPSTLAQDLIVALANNASPDAIIFSSETFAQFKDKLYPIPYAAYSERLYRDTNIDGAQIFLSKDGIVGLPLVVDPLVVYYNKDILAQSNFVVPVRTWANLQQVASRITKRDTRNTITQSTIALGTASNINNVRDILSALFMQAGSPIVAYDPGTDRSTAVLQNTDPTEETSPLAQALSFYTSFSNPTNSNYSWNNAFGSSLSQFLAGKSAYYIGRASELFTIQAQNPNLNFDVVQLFQTGASARPITFGSFLGVGVLKSAPNFNAAYAAVGELSSSAGIDTLSKVLSLPPVRRDLLQVQQSNPYVATFFNAALTTFSWPDPDLNKTEGVFKQMVLDVTSGRSSAEQAISDANARIQSSI